MPHLFFRELDFGGFVFLGFQFWVDPFWKIMFFKFKGACTSFVLAFMQFEIALFLQLDESTLRCYIWMSKNPFFIVLKFQ